jgi:prepilin-type N-terminal cleavage/methylation domain-containing protein
MIRKPPMHRLRSRQSRGFTLLEVLAAFAISLALLVPIALVIAGAAGTQAAVERAAALIALKGEAARIAAALDPLQTGTVTEGQFVMKISPDTTVTADPAVAFRLFRVRVSTQAAPDVILAEVLRIAP